MNDYTLGLDIGSKSVGWSLLKTDSKPCIEALGVRVFPEGVDRDTKGQENSKNATRREARSARRTKQRRNLRRDQLLKALQSAGFLPQDKQELQTLFNKNPYELRKKGLDEKLSPYELGRALFHLNQRRGFKSNRKSGEAKKDGVVIGDATELQKAINDKGCRTLGEYFAALNPEEQRIRDRYTFRAMYEKEFDMLWSKQAEYYPQMLTDELKSRISNDIAFFQRPIRWDTETIGNCELEPGEKRCPRGDWYARRFRILQDVNNLIIQNPDGTELKLTQGQRSTILEALGQKKELKFDDIRKKLNLMETQLFNLEQDGKVEKKLKGDIFAAEMKSKNLFGTKIWDEMPEAEKIALNNACIEMEDDELVKFLKEKYNFGNGKIDKVFKISLPDKYTSFSLKAIKKLLPFMEEGTLTPEAKKKAGYEDTAEEKTNLDQLPLPEDLRNPIVNKALFEVRKVINAVIRQFGKPERIILEMARDIKGSKKEREELHWKMKDNEKYNEEVRTKLMQDMNIHNPSRDDIIKYKLWVECGKVCPYTGKSISQMSLFGPNPEFQVEHILPYDRSLDDSYMNKTLCYVHENIHIKGNKTPYETYSSDTEKYEAINQRVLVLPYPKRKRFTQHEIELDECIKRELNDTRYICKEAVKYLGQLGVHVRGTRGKITNELRHQWGLNGIFTELGVERDDDHRRHAVDATVVAVTTNEHLRKLAKSKYSKAGGGVKFGQPWPDFREELREKTKHINVSHRVMRKVSGPLHEETSYGLTGLKDEKGQDKFVYRKKLEDLTLSMVENIVDDVVCRIVRERLAEHGINADSKDRKIPKDVWNEPLYMKNKKSTKKVRIKKVRIHDVKNNVIVFNNKEGKPYRAVEPGSNHHIEIFEYTDKKGNVKRDGKVVTMFEAVQRSQKGESVVKEDYGDGKIFVCSLAINEMFMLELDNSNSELHRVQKISSNGQVFFRSHTYAGDLQKQIPISKKPNTLKGHKVTVDPIGRIWRANDYKPFHNLSICRF